MKHWKEHDSFLVNVCGTNTGDEEKTFTLKNNLSVGINEYKLATNTCWKIRRDR